MVIPYYKPLGMTPLEAIRQLQSDRPELHDIPITYAGRLDPMAEGLLLLLTAEDIRKKDAFLALPKTYEATVLFGFGTDTYDILGFPKLGKPKEIGRDEIEKALKQLYGSHSLPYPPYSSKPVNGKPLWYMARGGNLDKISIPTREMNVLSITLLEVLAVKPNQLKQEVERRINKVRGDFRQSETKEYWSRLLDSIPGSDDLMMAKIRFEVASGTYIRSLTHLIGQSLSTEATLFALKRTAIGKYLASSDKP